MDDKCLWRLKTIVTPVVSGEMNSIFCCAPLWILKVKDLNINEGLGHNQYQPQTAETI